MQKSKLIMSNFEKQLSDYRRRKREEDRKEKLDYFLSCISFGYISNGKNKTGEIVAVANGEPIDIDYEPKLSEIFNWKKIILYTAIWGLLFSYAIHIEFGAVYFILSGFFIIWMNTRTRPKYTNEISAYSVFNPGCQPIEGTVDAEQLQKELIFGPLAM